MPTAELVQIADAAVTALNGHAFSAPYQAPGFVRRYVPVEGLETLLTLAASVIPRGGTAALAQGAVARDRRRLVDWRISILLQKRVPGLGSAAVDELLLLSQEVSDFLFTVDLPGIAAVPVEVAEHVEFDEDQLDQFRLFVATFGITYRRPR